MSVPEEFSPTEMRDPTELEILRYANDNLIAERDALKARLLYVDKTLREWHCDHATPLESMLRSAIRLATEREDALKQIEEIAHSHTSGPTVPDVYWEIRAIAQSAI